MYFCLKASYHLVKRTKIGGNEYKIIKQLKDVNINLDLHDFKWETQRKLDKHLY